MKIRYELERYIPYNDQETKDKEFMLSLIENFDDVLTRNNEVLHFTSSGFVVNKEKTKALMIYHNIYDSWAWTGGHADGEDELLQVAVREVEEETSVKNISVLNNGDIIAIDSLPVAGHVKRGKYVPSHIHLSVAYLLEADDNEEIKIKVDENSNVAWMDIDKVVELSTEPHMKKVYEKIINRIKEQ